MLNNYPDLDENLKINLLMAGHEFLRVLSEVSDPECAQTVFNGLADHVHVDFKHDLFMRMLAGTMGKVVLRSVGSGSIIDCIKIIRQHTNMGLKEAKDLVYQARTGGYAELTMLNPRYRVKLIEDLRSVGCTVNGI